MLLLRAVGALRQQVTNTYPSGQGGLAIGEQVPALEAVDPNGKTVRLEETDGRYRLIAFISPGCQPCAQAIKVLDALWQDESDLSILVLGAKIPATNAAYAIEQQVHVPILAPVPGFEQERFHVRGVPFALIVDKTGTVRAKGFFNDQETLSQLLQEAEAPLVTTIS